MTNTESLPYSNLLILECRARDIRAAVSIAGNNNFINITILVVFIFVRARITAAVKLIKKLRKDTEIVSKEYIEECN